MPLVETTEHNDESLLLDVADATLFGSSQRNLRQQQQQQPFLESLNTSSTRCNPPPTSLLSFPSKASSKTVMTDVSGITSDFQDVDLVDDGQHQEQQDTDILESSAALQDRQEKTCNTAVGETRAGVVRRGSGGDHSVPSAGTPMQHQDQQLSNSLPHQRRKLMSSTALNKIDDQSKHSYATSHLFPGMSEQAQIAHLQLKVKKLQGELENSKEENKTLLENFEQLQSLCNDLLLENARLKGLETLSEDPAIEAGKTMPPLKLPGDDDAILPVEEYTPGSSAKTPKKKNISQRNSTDNLHSEVLPEQQQRQQQQEHDLGLSSSSHHFFIDTEHSIRDEDNDELFYEVNPEGSDTELSSNDLKQNTVKHHHTMRRSSFVPTPQHQLEDLDIDMNGSQNSDGEDDGTEGGDDDLHIGFVHNRKPSFVKRSSTAPSGQISNDDTTSVQSLPSAAPAPSRWRLNPFASDTATGTTADKTNNDDISICRSVEPTRTQSTSSLTASQTRFNDKNGYNDKLDATWMSLVGTTDDTNLFTTTSNFRSRRRRRSGEGGNNGDDVMSICSSPARPDVIGGGTNSERSMWKASSLRAKSSSPPTTEPETSSSDAPETSTKKGRRWSLSKMLSIGSTTSAQEDDNGVGGNITKNDETKGESEHYNNKNATTNDTDHIDYTGITSTSNTSSLTVEEDKSSLYTSMGNDDDDDDDDEEASTESDMPFDRTAMPGIANHMALSSTGGRVSFSSLALDENSVHSCQDNLDDDDELSVHAIEQKKLDQRIQQAQYYQEHSQGYL